MLRLADAPSVKLTGASLRDAILFGANLDGAALAGADLTGASFGRTVVTGCVDLDRATGLTTITHAADSAIDVVTFERLRATLPSAFVTGLGIGA